MIVISNTRQRAVLAMLIFNKLKNDGTISRLIASMPKNMRYTNVDPEIIADSVNMANFRTSLDYYTPAWPWSSAYAKVNSGDYSRIYLSTRKLDRLVDSLCGSIAHEWGHCLEFWWKENIKNSDYFNHGDNVRKDDTFQYQLGMKVKAYVEENKSELLRSIGCIK